MRVVRLKPEGKVVFVGDTHGDRQASEYVIDKYLKPGYRIVFLGDYVDRGPESQGNVEFLLNMKHNNPKQVYLLQGNHESFMIYDFLPADFWLKLGIEERKHYADIFSKLPFAVSVDGIIAVHGGLPDKPLYVLDKVELGSGNWRILTWGDYKDDGSCDLDAERPELTKNDFKRTMKRLRKQVLIRSHDPAAPLLLYDNRCLTLFSSNLPYRTERTIAIADFDKNPSVRTIDDLVIERF